MNDLLKPFGRAFAARREVIRAGNICYSLDDLRQSESLVAHYLANGVIGGCFDPVGTMNQGDAPGQFPIQGDTVFCYRSHFVHDQFGMDYALPVGRIAIDLDGESVDSPVERLRQYRQELDLSEAMLRTQFEIPRGDAGDLRVYREQFFSRERRHLFAMRQRFESPSSAEVRIRFVPAREVDLHYGGHFETEGPFVQNGRELWWPISTNRETTFVVLYVEGGEPQGYVKDGIVLKVHGEQEIHAYFSILSSADDGNAFEAARSIVGVAVQDGWKALVSEHQDAWRRYWNESLVQFPGGAEEQQKVWLRSNYYLGSTLSSTPSRPPLVTGLARIAWPSYFPQDYLYLYQNTLSANHLPLARSTRGHWMDILPHAESYAEKLFELPGAYFPWTPPIRDWSDYHEDGVPNQCYYEHHNSAYVSRMCYDYFRYTGDLDGLRQVGYPVVRAIALMYEGMLSDPEGEGPLHIRYKPSKSQDEYAPANVDNLFDLFVSAEYALRVAIRCASVLSWDRGHVARWEGLLERGFDYGLLDRGDLYGVYEGDDRPEGAQKHPVQLNPIALLPIQHLYHDYRTMNAYRRRYDMARGYEDGKATAWTLGEFLLSSTRFRSVEGFHKDWSLFRHCELADERWIQIREGTNNNKLHFLTTQGFVMEALTECAVQDWLGCIEPFAFLLPEWREGTRESPFLFENLRTQGGFLVSGALEGRDCQVDILSTVGGPLTVKLPLNWRGGALIEFPGRRVATGEGGQILKTNTLAGRRYQLRPLGV